MPVAPAGARPLPAPSGGGDPYAAPEDSVTGFTRSLRVIEGGGRTAGPALRERPGRPATGPVGRALGALRPRADPYDVGSMWAQVESRP